MGAARAPEQALGLIAVDFSRRGDLLGVVDALNGVSPAATR
jgi:hypothetical protein